MQDVTPTYTVTELAESVGRAVSDAFPDEVWVRGEIRDLSRHSSGNVYFTLVDPEMVRPDGTMPGAARLPVALFASDKDAVNWKLRRSGAGRMVEGTEVRIRGAISYYPVRGTVQLRMTWIDTEFVIGRLAARREELIRRLGAEGLLDRNAGLPVPLVPLRVGLVTSAGSAAHADFLHELEASGFAWRLVVCDARVQGGDAPRSIVAALAAVAGAVDVVALVRGGGARTELAAFDHEDVARAIATCLVPVITGIGHEVDTTVADRVAHAAHKTPTAAAGALVAQVRSYLDRLAARSRGIEHGALRVVHGGSALIDAAARRLARDGRSIVRAEADRLTRLEAAVVRTSARSSSQAQRTVNGIADRLLRQGRTHCDVARSRVRELERRFTSAPLRLLDGEAAKLDLVEAQVVARDPAVTLAHGFAIVRDEGGAIVRSAADVAPGDPIDLEFSDGHARARVDDVRRT